MAKLQASYKYKPFFYPAVGNLLMDAQVVAMQPEWDVKKDGSILAVDFTELDGKRYDWLFSDAVGYHRMRAVRTFAGDKAYWLVVETSY